jgi:hypothetical protein
MLNKDIWQYMRLYFTQYDLNRLVRINKYLKEVFQPLLNTFKKWWESKANLYVIPISVIDKNYDLHLENINDVYICNKNVDELIKEHGYIKSMYYADTYKKLYYNIKKICKIKLKQYDMILSVAESNIYSCWYEVIYIYDNDNIKGNLFIELEINNFPPKYLNIINKPEIKIIGIDIENIVDNTMFPPQLKMEKITIQNSHKLNIEYKFKLIFNIEDKCNLIYDIYYEDNFILNIVANIDCTDWI